MICEVEFDEQAILDMFVARGRAVLAAAASDCLDFALARCPVDTGQLRESGKILPDSNPDLIWVAFTAPYAAFVEFGHYTRNQVSWVGPNPFLRLSVADTIIRWPSLVSQVWANPVDKGDGSHYYASRFAYARQQFENQYTSLGFPTPGPSDV